MPGDTNNGSGSKGKQKNVSVYLGHKGDEMDEVLGALCVLLADKESGRKKTESELFRGLWYDLLKKWGIVDKDYKLIDKAVERLKKKKAIAEANLLTAKTRGLPSSIEDRLDSESTDLRVVETKKGDSDVGH